MKGKSVKRARATEQSAGRDKCAMEAAFYATVGLLQRRLIGRLRRALLRRVLLLALLRRCLLGSGRLVLCGFLRLFLRTGAEPVFVSWLLSGLRHSLLIGTLLFQRSPLFLSLLIHRALIIDVRRFGVQALGPLTRAYVVATRIHPLDRSSSGYGQGWNSLLLALQRVLEQSFRYRAPAH